MIDLKKALLINYRSGRATTIYVDQHAPVTKIVAGDNNQLNVYQALYIGNFLKFVYLSPKWPASFIGSKPGNIEGEIPQKGLRGCVAEIILGLNFRIDNINQVTQAVNIHDCSN